MMIVDVSGTANTPIWTESLAVTPNTQYTFAFWAASCGNDNANGIDPSPAIQENACLPSVLGNGGGESGSYRQGLDVLSRSEPIGCFAGSIEKCRNDLMELF